MWPRGGAGRANLGFSKQIWIAGVDESSAMNEGKAMAGDGQQQQHYQQQQQASQAAKKSRYKAMQRDVLERHVKMKSNMEKSHGGGPDDPPWELDQPDRVSAGVAHRRSVEPGQWERQASIAADLVRQRNANARHSHGSEEPPWERHMPSGSVFDLEGQLRGFAPSRHVARRRDPDDCMWRSEAPPQRSYELPSLPPPRSDDESEKVLRAWRGGSDRLMPEEARRKNGGRPGAWGGGRSLQISEAARMRAIEVLKTKERELVSTIGKATFKGQMSAALRPVYREKAVALELHLREVETALLYYQTTRSKDLPGAVQPHRYTDRRIEQGSDRAR